MAGATAHAELGILDYAPDLRTALPAEVDNMVHLAVMAAGTDMVIGHLDIVGPETQSGRDSQAENSLEDRMVRLLVESHRNAGQMEGRGYTYLIQDLGRFSASDDSLGSTNVLDGAQSALALEQRLRATSFPGLPGVSASHGEAVFGKGDVRRPLPSSLGTRTAKLDLVRDLALAQRPALDDLPTSMNSPSAQEGIEAVYSRGRALVNTAYDDRSSDDRPLPCAVFYPMKPYLYRADAPNDEASRQSGIGIDGGRVRRR